MHGSGLRTRVGGSPDAGAQGTEEARQPEHRSPRTGSGLSACPA